MSLEVQVTRHALTEPDALSGAPPPAAVHWALTPAALTSAAADVRTHGEVLVVRNGPRMVGYLPAWRYEEILKCYDIARSSPALATHLGGRRVYVAGSHQQMAGEAVLDSTLSTSQRLRVLATLLDAAANVLSAPLVVPFVAVAHPLTGCSPSRVFPGPTRYWLEPEGSREEFLALLPRSRREILMRDYRHLEREGMELTTGEPDLDDRHCALISQIKERHDILEPPMLVRWRMSRWRASVERPTMWSVRDAVGELVAFAVGSHGADRRLEVYEAGVDWTHQLAHPAYIAAMILGPLETAWATGQTTIGLGFDSGTPKRLRGADEEDTVHLLFDESPA